MRFSWRSRGCRLRDRTGTLRNAESTVTDQQGQPIPAVTVTITNAVSGEPRVHVTDANGQHPAPDFSPGRYNVAFELSGFAKVERSDISVLLGRSFDINAQMRVGQLAETVQVSARGTTS